MFPLVEEHPSKVKSVTRPTCMDRDHEMTGLNLTTDALIEVAALVTDFELNVLGEGVDLIIKPSQEALDQMVPFVRQMHVNSGLLDELAEGISLSDAEDSALAYIRSTACICSRPSSSAGNSVATDRKFLARDMTKLDESPHYRIIDVSSIGELSCAGFPVGPFRLTNQRRQPSCACWTSRKKHRGVALLAERRSSSSTLAPTPRPRHRPPNATVAR